MTLLAVPMNFDARHTTFVVQGPVLEVAGGRAELGTTAICLASIRKWFPEAEIVLSTWRGANTKELQFDVLAENDDPGPLKYAAIAKVNPNFNRMLVSSRNGVAAATRRYVVKTRTDILFSSDSLAKWIGVFERRARKTQIFNERIIVPTVFSVQPRRGVEDRLYHLSDWLHAGTRRDVELLWSCPLAAEISNPEAHKRFPAPDGQIALTSFANEQYLWLQVAQRIFPDLNLDHAWDHEESKCRQFEQFVADEIVLVSPEQLGIRHVNYRLRFTALLGMFTHGEWLRLYREYCDKDAQTTFDFRGRFRQAVARCDALSRGALMSAISTASRISKRIR